MVCGALLLLASLLVPAAPVPVRNGDFEAGLEGWSHLKPDGFAHGEFRLVTDDVHQGRQAVRLTNPAGEKVLTGLLTSGFVALPADSRSFELRLAMKVITRPAVFELRVAATDAAGQVLAPFSEHGWQFLRPTIEPAVGAWRVLSMSFVARPNWGGTQLTLWFNGPGADVLLDDLQIHPVDPRRNEVERVGARLPAPADAALWWEGPLRKVYPSEAPPAEPGPAIELAACGGECETVQLCLRPTRPLRGARAECGPLRGPTTLPAAALRANWVGLVPVDHATTPFALTGPTPDPLLPVPTLDLAAGESRSLWLTVQPPRGTPAGRYQAEVTIRANGFAATVPLTLLVYGFDLPERPRLRTISRIWQHHEDDLTLFRRNLAAHRAGGSNTIGGLTARREGDRVVVDAAGLKAAADANLRAHGAEVFNVPSIYLGDWSGPYSKDRKWFGFDLFSPPFETAFRDYCRTVGDALRAEGLLPYALWQIWDEPHGEWLPRVKRLAELVKEGAPDAAVYVTAAIDESMIDLVDIWNLPWPGSFNADLAARVRARGKSLWAYENRLYHLDTPDSALQLRGYLWRLRRYDIAGVEWWAVSSWKSDPWTKPNQYEPQNGGGFFLYPTPDRKGAPIDSLRWELYREGVEDYDLLTLYGERYGRAALETIVQQVALDPAEVARDPRLMDRLKRQVCEALATPR